MQFIMINLFLCNICAVINIIIVDIVVRIFAMARLGGLQLSKPSFDWDASDKLTE